MSTNKKKFESVLMMNFKWFFLKAEDRNNELQGSKCVSNNSLQTFKSIETRVK